MGSSGELVVITGHTGLINSQSTVRRRLGEGFVCLFIRRWKLTSKDPIARQERHPGRGGRRSIRGTWDRHRTLLVDGSLVPCPPEVLPSAGLVVACTLDPGPRRAENKGPRYLDSLIRRLDACTFPLPAAAHGSTSTE